MGQFQVHELRGHAYIPDEEPRQVVIALLGVHHAKGTTVTAVNECMVRSPAPLPVNFRTRDERVLYLHQTIAARPDTACRPPTGYRVITGVGTYEAEDARKGGSCRRRASPWRPTRLGGRRPCQPLVSGTGTSASGRRCPRRGDRSHPVLAR